MGPNELKSKLLKKSYTGDYLGDYCIEVIEGDTRSLDQKPSEWHLVPL